MPARSTWRRRPLATLAALVVALAAAVALPAGAAGAQAAGTGNVSVYQATLQPLNDSGVTGTASMVLDGSKLTTMILAYGLLPNAPHAQHVHGLDDASQNAVCPPASAAGADDIVSLSEGAPFYGGVLLPLTSPPGGGALDPAAFPTTPQGVLDFEETYDVDTSALAPLENRTVVLHGLDVNDDGTLTGDEVTHPVACGQIEMVGEGQAAYVVGLDPLNDSGVQGTAVVVRNQDDLLVTVLAEGLEPGMPHPQHIHGLEDATQVGECPPPEAAGGDGLLSLEDGLPFYGPVILPLTSPPGGAVEDFPNAPDGTIDFGEEYEFDEALSPLDNRVIVLHGMTVDGTYQATLPVACGQLERVLGDSLYLMAADGGVFALGEAPYLGSAAEYDPNFPIIGGAVLPTGDGYWQVATDGGVFSFGEAEFHGSTGGIALNEPIVGMAATPSGGGYWLVAADGGVFAFGDAGFYGSASGIDLNEPVIGMTATASGEGYWLVGADGGVFSYGDAEFYGSTGGIDLAEPVLGIVSPPTGDGYWLFAADGGVFTFGDIGFHGSTGGMPIDTVVIGMASSPTGGGYWLAGIDGSVYGFGDALSIQTVADLDLAGPVVAAIAP